MAAIFMQVSCQNSSSMATLEALKSLIATLLVLPWQPFCKLLPWQPWVHLRAPPYPKMFIGYYCTLVPSLVLL